MEGLKRNTKAIRVVFEAKCYAEGKDYKEAYENFLNMDLFGNGKAEWASLICIEDADSNKDITNEIDK